MKSNLLYLAMFLLVLCVPLRGNGKEVSWFWTDLPWVPLTLITVALICIARYIYKKRIMEETDRTTSSEQS